MPRNHRSLGNGWRQEVINDVPSSQVDRVEQDFKDAGAISVMRSSWEGSDTYRVVAIFPGESARG